MTSVKISSWLHDIFIDLAAQLRWSYLPPLMVYLAYGISGLTAIVGTFFTKEYLGLSAAFLAGLTFWAAIPWTLKMPLGHLIDLIWRWKSFLVYLGSILVASSLGIMYSLITYTDQLKQIMSVEVWYVSSVMLSAVGFVIQDVVADAMTVEAVHPTDRDGNRYSDETLRKMHVTMQTLGRFALISGLVLVAILNIFMFSGIETMSTADKAEVYAQIYLIALFIPLISVSGVMIAHILTTGRAKRLKGLGYSAEQIKEFTDFAPQDTRPNWWILGGGLVFVIFTLSMGTADIAFSQEIIFLGSMGIVLFLMSKLIQELPKVQARALVGTAIIIFVFRATPSPGAGATWFEIDILKFDQQFLSVLSLITSCLTLVGIIVLRPMMANRSIAYIVVFLTFAAGILSLPNIGLFYGLHEWTSGWSNGVIDARFIAILDTAIESPLGQIAMIPMLAWIAKNAPSHLKATFFAVMASFTNLALSAGHLGTKYINQIFIVSREVKGEPPVAADYSQLGMLLITVTLITVIMPLIAIFIVQW